MDEFPVIAVYWHEILVAIRATESDFAILVVHGEPRRVGIIVVPALLAQVVQHPE